MKFNIKTWRYYRQLTILVCVMAGFGYGGLATVLIWRGVTAMPSQESIIWGILVGMFVFAITMFFTDKDAPNIKFKWRKKC